MIKPNKDELKRKYNITDEDFDILTDPPSEFEIKNRKSFLVKVGEMLGVPVWLWKNFSGKVIAVIIGTSALVGHYNNITPVFRFASNQFTHYMSDINFEKAYNGFAVFFPDKNQEGDSKQDGDPLYTMIAPASGSFHG